MTYPSPTTIVFDGVTTASCGKGITGRIRPHTYPHGPWPTDYTTRTSNEHSISGTQSVINQFSKMRSYGKNWVYKKTSTYKERQTRLATEWDLRFDISEELTAETIVKNIKASLDGFLYVAVSGVERPDDFTGPDARGRAASENHVHLCVVLYEPVKRIDVLQKLRGPRKIGDEYASPRNPKFTYAGWYIHHAKLKYKLPGEVSMRYEYGTLPMDPMTVDTAIKIEAMQKKFGSSYTQERFKSYLTLLDRAKIREKIEKLQMQLEDNDVVVN